MDKLDTDILEVMASVFEMQVSEINVESSQDTIESWDSVNHINLVVALEEEFNIAIPIEEVGNMMSFRLIKLIVSELLNL